MYLWIKAFHIMAIITWFAGLFYLPRLFVYHAQSEDSISRERFKVMERKLYRGIMNPSMLVALALGIWLLYLQPVWLSQGWMHAKLTLVVLLVGYHHMCGAMPILAHTCSTAGLTRRRYWLWSVSSYWLCSNRSEHA